MFSAVILCAGSGQRMNIENNKVLLPLENMPIFMHSVNKFKELTSDVVVVCSEKDINEIKKYHDNVCLGGINRQESVYRGIINSKYDKVLIHDGARPFVSLKEIQDLMSVEDSKSAFLGTPMVNTIKNKDTFENVNRDNIVVALTPQLVDKNTYIKAYQNTDEVYTDDVSLIQGVLNIKPKMVLGSKENIKITTYDDYLSAVKRTSNLRIGHSWDVHKLVVGRKLYLGGILLEHDKGLLGHSDADALLHAIAESLLGALALGDLGSHFPDNDPKYKGIESKILLKKCNELTLDKGYKIINLDTMIYAEQPKMKPYINLMRESISQILDIDISQISIKATTYEKMDAIGRGEAIACDSTVLIGKI